MHRESKSAYVIDDIVLIHGLLREERVQRIIQGAELIVPKGVIRQLETMASQGDRSALAGLAELARLKDLEKRGEIASLRIVDHGFSGIEALEEVAKATGAVILTGDSIRAIALGLKDVKVEYVGPPRGRLTVEQFFTEDTMSIHLKEGAPPLAKRGRPGEFRLVKLREEPLTHEEVRKMAYEIIERAKLDPNAFIEVRKKNAYVIQFGEYRILVAFPPFSDGIEITAVRPVVRVTLEDYDLSEKLKERLAEKAEGVVIAGPPGAGKTTFASALAEFYRSLGKIVKTLESPRDLMVGPEVTQYGKLDGSFESTADLLLLVRPDYVIFDEMRKTDDFMIFVDMRLAGIGMVGVVHCGAPIEAIQRFIGRVDLGLLPHVVDTVIFIQDGRVVKVYSLKITVKLPIGMQDTSLARPVVLVSDFETGIPEYEIYTFGDEVVVMPVGRPRVRAREARVARLEREGLRYRLIRRKHTVVLDLGPENADQEIIIMVDGREFVRLTTDSRGRITLARNSPAGRRILEAARRDRLSVFPSED